MVLLHDHPLPRQEARLATHRKPEKDRQLDDGRGRRGVGVDRIKWPQESLSSLNHSILSAIENVKGILLQANLSFHVCTEYFMRLWAKLNYFPEHFMFRIYFWTHALLRMLRNFSTFLAGDVVVFSFATVSVFMQRRKEWNIGDWTLRPLFSLTTYVNALLIIFRFKLA